MKPIVLLLLSIISFGLCYISLNSIRYKDIDSESECNEALITDLINFKENGQCHAWDGSQCRKGFFNKDKNCEYKGSYFPLVFLTLGLLLLLYASYSYLKTDEELPSAPSAKIGSPIKRRSKLK
jgi:hypothetical protein